MSYIETFPIKNSTIIFIYSEKDVILLDPPYQRMGGVWNEEKKQLLIDSIINDYDIPKIYFHEYSQHRKSETGYSYAVIDGRQRLETIWEFIDGAFDLSEDFEYQRDDSINLAGLSYDDIGKSYPKIKIKFDSFVLPVISVDTDDEELIEDMFSRLNEAVPLNSAEKRNAIGGDMVAAIRKLADHSFFKKKVKFSNKRYHHREVSARFLLLEENLKRYGKFFDTKKIYLDSMARNYHTGFTRDVKLLLSECQHVLDYMNDVFTEKDDLLRSQGNLVVYYLLFRIDRTFSKSRITRHKFLKFLDDLRDNRISAAESIDGASFELLEYDRLSQQGTNDSTSIKARLKVLLEHFKIPYKKISYLD
ncbi:MAG: DUF262 domain-containing protein [Cellvibrio sp.]|uniref:DUF262 domain-containing protein n=1 Tax=Cellvibrio sp. TaxID=1965322 RepID=UPI00271A6CE6|nr:DUF262 domain-containing protein [Cellvibrio sp.]